MFQSLINRTVLTGLSLALSLASVSLGQVESSRMPLTAQAAPDGALKPWRESKVATSESGLVTKILVKLGDKVELGQSLAELDCDSVRIQLNMAEIQAESAGRINTAKAEVDFHQEKLVKLEELAARNHAFPSELEKARADLRMAQGRLESELQERRIYGKQVEKLKQQLHDRTIYAPIQGVVVELYRELGEYVAPNSPQVVRIADVSKLKASFFLMDEEVKQIAGRTNVKVSLPSGQLASALVDYLAPVADGESGLLELRVLIDNPVGENIGSRCSLVIDDLGPVAVNPHPSVVNK